MYKISNRLLGALSTLYALSKRAKEVRAEFKLSSKPEDAKKLRDATKEQDKTTEQIEQLLLGGDAAELIETPKPDETEEKPTKTSRQIADEAEIEAAKAANERISKY